MRMARCSPPALRRGPRTACACVVDERGARYPLTIDPIAQQAYLKPAREHASG